MASRLDLGFGSPNRGLASPQDRTPLSLYFDIPEGSHANLEIVAKSALEWVAIVRELAAVVAPGVEFEIELVETEDGSLWLSNLLKALKEGDRKALAAIVWAVLVFFAMGPVFHLQADAGDRFWEALGHEDFNDISEEDKADIARKVIQGIAATTAGERRQKIIREAEKDATIKGIGVARAPTRDAPSILIKRDDFPFYAPDVSAGRPQPIKDTNYRNSVRVMIARANLDEGEAKPRWRFKEGDTKWSADIEDAEFVEALNAETTGLPLAVGQVMVVDVAIDVKLVDGAWEESNRRIIRVIQPIVNRRQQDLDLRRE